MWGDRTSQSLVILHTKIGSKKLVWRLSGPLVHFYKFLSTRAPILGPDRLETGPFGDDVYDKN